MAGGQVCPERSAVQGHARAGPLLVLLLRVWIEVNGSSDGKALGHWIGDVRVHRVTAPSAVALNGLERYARNALDTPPFRRELDAYVCSSSAGTFASLRRPRSIEVGVVGPERLSRHWVVCCKTALNLVTGA